jgi:hypothetical protein
MPMRAAGTVAVPISMPELPGALERAHIGRTSPQLPVPKRDSQATKGSDLLT